MAQKTNSSLRIAKLQDESVILQCQSPGCSNEFRWGPGFPPIKPKYCAVCNNKKQFEKRTEAVKKYQNKRREKIIHTRYIQIIDYSKKINQSIAAKYPKNITIPKTNQKRNTINRADMWFSRYIRLSHTVTVIGGMPHCYCYTCQTKTLIPAFEIEDGHFIPRGKLPTRYHTQNNRPQCHNCNGPERGRYQTFKQNLITEIGEEQVKLIIALSRQEGESTIQFYKKIADHFKTETMRLIKELDASPWWK